MVSTVTTSTYASSVGQSPQRQAWYANGRYWVVYRASTYAYFISSTDGSSWSSSTQIGTATSMVSYKDAIWWDGTYVYYTNANATNVGGYWRRGTCNSDGTITWGTVYTLPNPTGTYRSYYNTSKDTSGYPWATFGARGTYYAPYAVRATATDGSTWGTPALLAATTANCYIPAIYPLASGKMVAVYSVGTDLLAVFYDGSSWGTASSVATIYAADRFIGVSDGDDEFYIVYSDSSSDVYYRRYVDGTGWSTAVKVADSTDTTYVSAGVDSSGNLHMVWSDGGRYIYRRTRFGGTGLMGTTSLVYDAGSNVSIADLTAEYNPNASSEMFVVWSEGTASPYTIKSEKVFLGTPVSKTVKMPWNVLSYVSPSTDKLVWSIRASIASTTKFIWDTRNLVGTTSRAIGSFVLPSPVEQTETADTPKISLVSNIRVTVGKTLVVPYRLGPKVWVAPANGNASVGSNWSDGIAPKIGDEILFDSTSTYNCTWNVTTQVGYFRIATGYTGTITNSVAFSCGEFRQEDGVFTVAGGALSHYYYGTFRLYGGVYNGNSGSTCLYYGSASITSSSYGTAGQMCFMTDGSWFYFNGNLNLTHLGFRGSISMTDCIGYVRCITQFYCISASGEKTLTLNNSKIRIYHTAVAAIDVTGTWNMVGSNGAVLQIALYDNRTLDTELSEINLDINLEFLGVSGQVAAAELEMNQAINVGENYNITVYTEDATQTFYLDTNNYTMTCHDLTVSARGYLKGGTSSFHIYGSLTTYLGTSIFSSSTVYMYNAGENIECNGYTNRIRYLHLLPSTGTITSGAINTTTLLIDTSGYINGNGCTLALGNARLYQYTANATVCFQGTGTITSNQNGTAGYWFILYALTQASAFTNLNQGNWTFDCDVFFSPERSMTYAIETWLTGNIVTSKTLRIAHAGSYGLKPHLQGYDITAHTMLWNSTYGYLVYVDASVGSSEIRITGGSFTAYNGYVQFDRGQSHLYLEGTGNVYPASLHFHDVTVSGTYTVQVANGHCENSRTVTGTLNETLGYYLLYWMPSASVDSIRWNIREPVAISAVSLSWKIRNFVSGTRTLIYNIKNIVAASDRLIWNIRGGVMSYDRLVWNLRSAVFQSRRFVWNMRGIVSRARVLMWSIRNRAVSSDKFVWSIRGAASAVFAKLLYNLRETVADFRKPIGLMRIPNQVESVSVEDFSGAHVRPLYDVHQVSGVSADTLSWNLRNATGISSDRLIWHIWNRLVSSDRLIWSIRNRATSSDKLMWNIWNHLISTGTLSWSIRNRTSASSDRLVWSIRNRAEATDKIIWSIRASINSHDRLVWHVWNKTTSVDKIVWNLRNGVGTTDALVWNIWNKRGAVSKLVYHVLGRITSYDRLVWNVWNVRTASTRLIWNLKNRMSAAVLLVYNLRNDISYTRWPIGRFVLPNPVESTSASEPYGVTSSLSYHLRNTTGTTDKLVWNLRALTGASSDKLMWNIWNRLISADTLVWSMRNTTVSSDRLIWNVWNTVKSSDTLTWNLRNLTSASADRLVWNIWNNLVSSDRLVWSLRNHTAVSSDKLVWNIWNRLISVDTILWNVRSSILTDDKLVWNVWNKLTSTRKLVYNLRGRLVSSDALVWHIWNKRSSAATLVWDINGILKRTMSFVYSMRDFVHYTRWPVGQFVLPNPVEAVTTAEPNAIVLRESYHIRNLSGAASDALLWNVRNTTVSADTLVWSIRSTVSSSRVLVWSILNRSTKTARLVYHILGRVSSSDTILWNIYNTRVASARIVWDVNGALRAVSHIVYSIRDTVHITRWPIGAFLLPNPVESIGVPGDDGVSGKYLYNIREQTGVAEDTLIWDVRNYARSTTTLLWDIIGALRTQTTLVYNILEGIHYSRWPIGQFVLPNPVETQATPEAGGVMNNFAYRIREIMPEPAATRLIWDLRTYTASSSVVLSWRLYHIVKPYTGFGIRYQILNTVRDYGSDLPSGLPFPIGSAPTYGRVLGLNYNIINMVKNRLYMPWKILGMMSVSKLMVYNIRESVSARFGLMWMLRSAVSSAAARLVYNLRRAVAGTRTFNYRIFARVSTASVKIVYHLMHSIVANASALLYNIRHSFSSSVSAIYNIRESTGAVFDILWNVRNATARSLRTVYHIRGFASSSLATISYRIRRLIHADDPILCLPLDQTDGLLAFDHSGFERHGALTAQLWDDGVTGGGLYFDGVTRDYVEIPNDGLRPTNITVSAWIKPMDSTVTLRAVVSAGRDAWIAGYNLFTTGLKLNVRLEIGPTFESNADDIALSSSDCLVIGEWNHVAFTYDSAGLIIYCNGSVVGSTSYAGDIKYEWYDTPVTLGIMSMYRQTTGYFKFYGYIDEARIYDRALSQEEIRRHAEIDYHSSRSEIAWRIRNTASSSTRVVYNIFHSLSSRFTMVYGVRGIVVSARKLMWGIRNRLVATENLLWSVRNGVGTSVRLLYSVLRIVGERMSVVYSIRNLAGAGTALAYNIRRMAEGVSFTLRYQIRLSVAGTVSAIYDIINKLTRPLRLRWVTIPWRPKEHEGDPYERLRDEIYDHVVADTVEGGLLDGFRVYKYPPTTTAVFTPCVIIHLNRVTGVEASRDAPDEAVDVKLEIVFKRTRKVVLEV